MMRNLLPGEPLDSSSDLEWMLQSGQASRPMLAEALVQEYYAPLYRLAHALLDDEDAADRAAKQAFRSALLGLSRYRSDRGAQTWLFSLALESFEKRSRPIIHRLYLPFSRKSSSRSKKEIPPAGQGDEAVKIFLDGLKRRSRLAVLLAYLLGWRATEIAPVLKESERRVQSRLARARQAYAETLRRVNPAEVAIGDEELDAQLARSLQARWPERQITPGEVRWASEAILAEVEKQGASRSRVYPITEVFWVGLVALIAIGLVWGGSRLLPEQKPASPPAPAATSNPTATSQPPSSPTAQATSEPESALWLASRDRGRPAIAYYPVARGDSLRDVAAKFGVLVNDLAAFNHLSVEETLVPYQLLKIPLQPLTQLQFTPTPVRNPAQPPPPLYTGSTPEEIYRRLLLSNSLWSTVWVDARLFDYGPQGYVGRPLASRLQLWISQPGLSKELAGPLEGGPYYHIITTGGYSYGFQRDSKNGWLEKAGEPAASSQLHHLIFPGSFDAILRSGTLRVVESGEVAGRQALVVDWHNEGKEREWRLWLDTQNAMILRLQQFGGIDGQVLLKEIAVANLVYDAAFPPELFDPGLQWGGNYARDYSGLPETEDTAEPPLEPAPEALRQPLLGQVPPSGFDPSRSTLTFQYPSTPDAIETASPDAGTAVEIFADDYYLGKVEFPQPWGLRCDRSPDGWRIAFTPGNSWQEFSSQRTPAKLHWFSLSNPYQVYSPLSRITVFDFAFSPDSRILAVVGFEGLHINPHIQIFLLDLNTGQRTSYLDLQGYADSLVWSPDGRYLALIGSEKHDKEALVVDAGSGEIVYRTPVEPDYAQTSPETRGPNWPTPDWPGHEWGIEFPVRQRGLENCAAPPQ